MKYIKITTQNSNIQPILLRYCNTFWSKFSGLMLVKHLENNSGVIFIESSESRMNTSIHMLFMNFDITVLWLDKNLRLVDKVLAKKWHFAYFPSSPAQYVIETNVNRFNDFRVGDQLIFEYAL